MKQKLSPTSIFSGEAHNFNKYNRGKIDTLKIPYDYDSIMHYGTDGFSKNGKPTLRSIRDPARALGQRKGFTQIDIQEINSLYQCSSKSFDFKYYQKSIPVRERLLFILKRTLFAFKVIPWYCIAHPYCERFSRHQRADMSACTCKT